MCGAKPDLKVGDTVEMEYNGGWIEAIIFDYGGELCLAYEDGEYDPLSARDEEEINWKGHTGLLNGITDLSLAQSTAKEYFAKPKSLWGDSLPKPTVGAEYTPQVGDVVEFEYCTYTGLKGVMSPDGICALYGNDGGMGLFDMDMAKNRKLVGKIAGVVTHEDATREAAILAKSPAEPIFEGTYAERQAAWIKHHGIKKGSKVKITGPNDYSNGDNGTYVSHFQSELDEHGTDGVVQSIRGGEIIVVLPDRYEWIMPYFVLEPVTDSVSKTTDEFPELRPPGQRNLKNHQVFIATKSHWVRPAYQMVMFHGDKFWAVRDGSMSLRISEENLLLSPTIEKVRDDSPGEMRTFEADFKKKWPDKKLYVN